MQLNAPKQFPVTYQRIFPFSSLANAVPWLSLLAQSQAQQSYDHIHPIPLSSLWPVLPDAMLRKKDVIVGCKDLFI